MMGLLKWLVVGAICGFFLGVIISLFLLHDNGYFAWLHPVLYSAMLACLLPLYHVIDMLFKK